MYENQQIREIIREFFDLRSVAAGLQNELWQGLSLFIFLLYILCDDGCPSFEIKKIFFFFFYPHTLTFRLKRPVYRGFSGEGKCEGKCFTITLLSHLPSHPRTPTLPARKHPVCRGFYGWVSDSIGRAQKKQLFTDSIAMLHCWCTYAAPLVFLCWTNSIPMLNHRYSYAVPSVPECFTLLVPFFQFVYNAISRRIKSSFFVLL